MVTTRGFLLFDDKHRNDMSALTDLINAYIRRNANQEITGPVLNGVLLALASAAENVPYIGENGDWYLYDTETGQYADSGHSSTLFRDVAVDITEDGGDPSGSAVVSGTTLLLTLANIRGERGPEGPEGPAGPAGVTGASASIGYGTTPAVALTFINGQLDFMFSGIQGTPGTPGLSAGFGLVTASVDANVGTPSVVVTTSGPDYAKDFAFAFHNLKGAQGSPGTPGTAAGFGTPTASVDANTGTPSVAVTASGPDTAKVFDFAFHNLKGETGPAGSDADVTAENIEAALGYTPANAADVPATYAGSPTAGGFANKAVAIPFGNVDSTSTATALTATVDNFPTTLTDGVCAYIRNNAIASASGFTLNINSTGALPVYQTMADASRSTTIFSASTTYLFVYNSSRVAGGCWDIYYGYNSNENTIGYNLRTNSMSLPTTSACYRYRLLFTSANGTHFVPANASSSTNATSTRTTTQTPIDPFGSIRYYSHTSAVNSGSRPGVAYLWEQYLITLGYSFNRTGAALTLTSWKPVYIKCAPQSDGSAIIDADNPYVQDLPTTADGKIYIFLGVATEATKVEMVFHHPVYYFKDGSVRVWSNAPALPAIDQTPTEDSQNLVTSGGVYAVLGDVETLINAL